MLQIFDIIHIFTLSAFLIDPSYRTECESYYCWVIWIRGVWRTIVSGLVAVLYSDFRTKNGAHTTLTMIPNSRKQVPCVFLLVLEIIWDWDQKRWPIPLRFAHMYILKPFLKKKILRVRPILMHLIMTLPDIVILYFIFVFF